MADNNYEHPGPDEPAGGSRPKETSPPTSSTTAASPSPASMTPGEGAADLPAPPRLRPTAGRPTPARHRA